MEENKQTEKIEFIKAALAACNNDKRQGMFQCPICKNIAIAMKSNVDDEGIMANCPECKMFIRPQCQP